MKAAMPTWKVFILLQLVPLLWLAFTLTRPVKAT